MADTVLCVSGAADFRERAWEFPISIAYPSDDKDMVSDMELSIYGHPTPWNSAEGSEATDIRLYWNDREITQAVRHQLQSKIDQADQSLLLSKFRLVLSRYFYDGKFGYPPNADQLLATRPFSKLLTVLGHGTPDSVFNFLYRDLPIQPISLSAVLQEALPAFPTDWGSLIPATLTLSAGPCRFYTDGWKPEDHRVAGGVTYRLDYKVNLTVALARIEAAVSSDGTIQTVISKVRNQLDNLSARIEKCDGTMGDAATLDSIRRDLDQIKSNLNIA